MADVTYQVIWETEPADKAGVKKEDLPKGMQSAGKQRKKFRRRSAVERAASPVCPGPVGCVGDWPDRFSVGACARLCLYVHGDASSSQRALFKRHNKCPFSVEN